MHPDRVQPDLGRPEAWHFSARQIESITDGPLGWAPVPEPNADRIVEGAA